PCPRRQALAGTGRQLEAAVASALAVLADHDIRYGRVGEEALMRPAALHPAAVGPGPQHLGDDVVVVTLAVTLDDGRVRAHEVADVHGCEELPFLARMQVADQVRQGPRQGAGDPGGEDGSGCA